MTKKPCMEITLTFEGLDLRRLPSIEYIAKQIRDQIKEEMVNNPKILFGRNWMDRVMYERAGQDVYNDRIKELREQALNEIEKGGIDLSKVPSLDEVVDLIKKACEEGLKEDI